MGSTLLGTVKMPILNPKHMRKRKIRLLEHLLGHPIHIIYIINGKSRADDIFRKAFNKCIYGNTIDLNPLPKLFNFSFNHKLQNWVKLGLVTNQW